jgi:mannosyl-3-phosphoglycerate phosphatase
MDIVFSDLDGTLLDQETYSFEKALPGVALLKSRSVPLIFCTSKTRSEVEYWRTQIGNSDPFIVENGGAVYIPVDCFAFSIPGAPRRREYQVVQLGTEYSELVTLLQEASARSECGVRGFHQMTTLEISALCGLDPQLAELAQQREFDEPFVILDPDKEEGLVAAIDAAGMHFARGGRFCHIVGNNDKALAVQYLLQFYRRTDPPLRTIGLGDGLNDAALLNSVDLPILINSPWLERLQAAVPNGRPTASSGPMGWNEAITAIFGEPV